MGEVVELFRTDEKMLGELEPVIERLFGVLLVEKLTYRQGLLVTRELAQRLLSGCSPIFGMRGVS
jgi:hypothetical protein